MIRGAFGASRIVLLLLIARAVGASDFGKFALALSFIEIFKVVADLGLDIVSIRRFAAEPLRAAVIMNTVVGLKLVFSTCIVVIAPMLFLLLYRAEEGLSLLLILSLSVYTTLLSNAFLSYFQSQLSILKALPANLTGVILYVTFTAAGLLFGWPLEILAVAVPAGELVMLTLLMRRYARENPLHFRIDRNLAKALMRDSIFVGIAGILVVLYIRLDHLLINGYLGTTEVGRYAVAYRLVEPFFLLFSSLSVSVYASISARLNTPAESSILGTMKKVSASVLAIAAAGIAILAFVVAPNLSLLSSDYSGLGNVLLVLSFSLVPKGLNPQLTALLNSMGKFRTLMVVTISNLAVNVLLNIILIPRLGILGAAVAIVATESFNSLVQSIIALRSIRQHFGRTLLNDTSS